MAARVAGVPSQDELSSTLLDTAAYSRPLPPVGRQDEDPYFGVSASLDSLRGSVHATIIDDQDLERLASGPDVCEHAVQRLSYPRCFVVCGYDDR